MTGEAQPPQDDGADPELDASILAHDATRTRYVLAQRAFRRRVAVYLLIVFLLGGSAMIAYGLSSDAAAKRISEISNVIGTFMMSIAGLLAAYFGAGSMDNRSMLGGGMGSMYGGYGNSFGSFNSTMRRTTSGGSVSSRAD